MCDSAGELTDLLFCTGCGQHYHAACLEIGATPIQRAGWQCPECKVCQTCRLVYTYKLCQTTCLLIWFRCSSLYLFLPFKSNLFLFHRQPGDDSKMLVCDACDKGYHTFCLQPAMDSLPCDPWKCRVSQIFSSELRDALIQQTCSENGHFGIFAMVFEGDMLFFGHLLYSISMLFCQRCRICTECGVRGLVLSGSAQWFDNYAVCEDCQRQRSSTCGVCSKAATPSVILQCCTICHRFVSAQTKW